MILNKHANSLPPKHRQLQRDVHHCSLYNLQESQRISSPKICHKSKAKMRGNYTNKLQKIKNTFKQAFNIYTTNKNMFSQGNNYKKQEKKDKPKLQIDNIRLIGRIRAITSFQNSLISPQRVKATQFLKHYFKHLNLQAENHESFVGSSIILHKRQFKRELKQRSSNFPKSSYRNGCQSAIIKQSPNQLPMNSPSKISFRYNICQTQRNKPSISPWEGACEMENVNLPSTKKKKVEHLKI